MLELYQIREKQHKAFEIVNSSCEHSISFRIPIPIDSREQFAHRASQQTYLIFLTAASF